MHACQPEVKIGKKSISVIVCTYNRAHNLETCFRHLAAQKGVENIDWEIIFVDNNSTDNTRDVIKTIQSISSIPVRYILEKEQGLSHARNCGIKESAADILIFIDDDIRVVEKWLFSIYTTFQEHQCDAVGGRIHLQLRQKLPNWIQPEMYGFLGHRDFGDHPFKMDGESQFPFGGNMAFSRGILEKVGLFDTRMGRVGEGKKREELFKGEEADFFQRVKAANGEVYYQPDAIVLHKVLPHQLKKSFFRTLHFNAGFQRALLDGAHYEHTIHGVPRFLFMQALRSLGIYLHQLVTSGTSFAFRQQMNIGYFSGMILGYSKKLNILKGRPNPASE